MSERIDAIQKQITAAWQKLAAPRDVWASVNDYIDRINEIFPGQWSIEFESIASQSITYPASYPIKCRISVLNAVREGVAANDDIKVACIQAFTNACELYGMGRLNGPQQ